MEKLDSLPKPQAIHTRPAIFAVKDDETIPKGTVYFKTMGDYENMAMNMADVLRYITDANAYMEQCK